MMNLKKHRLFVAALAVTAAFSMAACGNSKESEAEPTDDLQTECPIESPEPADYSASELFSKMDTTDLDGNTVDSSVFVENNLTLVNVWNVGCTPCVEEIPVLDKLNKEYEGKGVSIKGLYYDFTEGISDESRQEVEEILADAKAEYQQLLLSKDMTETEAMSELGVFPTTYLVDSEGHIIDTLEGSNDYDGWKAVIEAALKQVKGDV